MFPLPIPHNFLSNDDPSRTMSFRKSRLRCTAKSQAEYHKGRFRNSVEVSSYASSLPCLSFPLVMVKGTC